MLYVVVSMLLARHGETPDNAHGLILGRRDPPLSPAGEEQSARLAASIATDGLAAIWCSPLLRARQTAAAVSPELFAAFEAAQEGFAFPGGESLAQQVQRTRSALAVVAGGPSPALVVAHAGTIRVALIAVGRKPPPERALAHGEAISLTWPAGDPVLK